MQRRDFIKVIVPGTIGTFLIPSIFSGCSTQKLKALDGWKGPSSDQKDIRVIVLSYAILAPNPHNKQPWMIAFTSSNQFDLYVDHNRLLPETDPPFRQIHIGQGTFLENLDLASRHFGYRAKITYFPQGIYSNDEVADKPVASVELILDESIEKDVLFNFIVERQSNKRVYEDRELTELEVKQLMTAYDTHEYPLSINNDLTQRMKLAKILGKAMKIETSGNTRHAETVAMFRFNDEEVEKYRDGFGLTNSGITGFKKFMVETFFLGNRKDALDTKSSFAEATIDLTNDQANSAVAFGWIISKTNTRLDQVKVGRAYERICLSATKLGLALHPMSQVLQEYPDMASLQKEFLQFLQIPPGYTVQMLFRLGYAESVVHSPRRKLQSILKS